MMRKSLRNGEFVIRYCITRLHHVDDVTVMFASTIGHHTNNPKLVLNFKDSHLSVITQVFVSISLFENKTTSGI